MDTATIMDMMFNTEMIVKDMKGGKEDMTEKRFTIIDGIKKGTHSGIWDNQKQNNQRIGDELWLGEVVAMLNEGVMIAKENEQLKQSVNNLKDTIIKITIAYQRKYDRTIVDLVDEIHEEDITDLIKELKE